MISIIRVFYKDTPVMLKKDSRYPKHIAFLDQAEGLPNCPILWGVCYIVQIPSMEEVTRMMGNVTSSVCGRASSFGPEETQTGRSMNTYHKKNEYQEDGRLRDTIPLRNRAESTQFLGKRTS